MRQLLPSFQLKTNQLLESILVGVGLGLLVVGIAGSAIFFSVFKDRIYPGIYIDQVHVGGLTLPEAQHLLTSATPPTTNHQITVVVDDISVASSSAELGFHHQLDEAVVQAYEFGRVGFPLNRVWLVIQLSFQPLQLSSNTSYDSQKLVGLATQLAARVDLAGRPPQAILGYSGAASTLKIDPGQVGRQLLIDKTIDQLITNAHHQTLITPGVVASTSAELTDSQLTAARDRATTLVGKRLLLTYEDIRIEVNDQELVVLLSFPDGINIEVLNQNLATWQSLVDRPAINAEFEYDPQTLVVGQFTPPRSGLALNTNQAANEIKQLITTIELASQDSLVGQTVGMSNQQDISHQLPVEVEPPSITLDKTNNLGIKELIGFGESEYDHSITSRIHNVALTTQKINLTIVPPGEEFSFNQTLGEVSARTGFKPAYVIKDGQTVLGDGGGVCQVSTTLFRAALNAGLPITRRLQHSYRVSYYELNAKPGIDATVYAGNVDLRFINDTGHHLLIYGQTDSQNLYMKIELYGTSDGRTTEITDHQVWDFRSAPAPEYIPDPSLPPGVKKQIDWAVGGVKASFKNIVKNKNGQIIREEKYYSNYIPWSAKYLLGV